MEIISQTNRGLSMINNAQKIGKSLLIACVLNIFTPALSMAQEAITAEQIYKYAVKKDTASLSKVKQIDVKDADGNSAWCLAKKKSDEKIPQLLEKYGADKNQKCNFILTSNQKIGAGVLGVLALGGIAAAAGGGGGGSHDGSGKDSGAMGDNGGNSGGNTGGTEPPTPHCVHGTVQGESCACSIGWTGTLCDKIANGFIEGTDGGAYLELECQHGGTQVNDVCSCSGNWSGDTCEECNGNYIQVGDFCVLNCTGGKVMQDDGKCTCPTGMIDPGDGNCYQSCGENGIIIGDKCIGKGIEDDATDTTNNEDISISNEDIEDALTMYGVRSAKGDAYNATEGNTASITITNVQDTDTYGVYAADSSGIAANAFGAESSGTITINHAGSGDVYGVYGKGKDSSLSSTTNYGTYNAYNGGTGIINISTASTSTGAVYGVKGEAVGTGNIYSRAVNAFGADSTGAITINHAGSGDVYGVWSNGTYNSATYHYGAFNAYNAGVMSEDGADPTVLIKIANYDDGTVYGVYANGAKGSAYNAYADSSDASAKIDITNTGKGSVYGIYSEYYGAYNAYMNGVVGRSEGFINIKNESGTVARIVGVSGTSSSYNAYGSGARGFITIINETDATAANIYGFSASNFGYNAYKGGEGKIEITNRGEVGNIYGSSANTSGSGSRGFITIINETDATAANISGSGGNNAFDGGEGTIKITNKKVVTGDIYGSFGYNAWSSGSRGFVTIINETDATTANIYGSNSYNSWGGEGKIEIMNKGTVTGDIYGSGGNNVHNSGEGKIEITNSGVVRGDVYGSGGNNVHNSGEGTIKITNKREVKGNIYGSSNFNAYGSGARGVITITNESDATAANIYGVSGTNSSYNASESTGFITIINKSGATAANIYGVSGTSSSYNVSSSSSNVFTANNSANSQSTTNGQIRITQNSAGVAYGVYANNTAYNANSSASARAEVRNDYTINNIDLRMSASATGSILMDNGADGTVYGVYVADTSGSAYNASASAWASAELYNGSEDLGYNAKAFATAEATGTITLINRACGTAVGMRGANVYNETVDETKTTSKEDGRFTTETHRKQTSIIEMANLSDGTAVGIYSTSSATNSGDITIHNLGSGRAVGMYVASGSATNSGNITIDRERYTFKTTDADGQETSSSYEADGETGGRAIGVYVAKGSFLNDTDGRITISGADTAYGIYAEAGASVINRGTISIDGNECTNSNDCASATSLGENKAYIKMAEGATLFQEGWLKANTSIKLDEIGKVVASQSSKFETNKDISGDLHLNSSIVERGFDTEYRVDGMIDAKDSSGLNLKSESALFEASLENGTDAVMKIKSFESVVEDSKIASFLQNNYAKENNEQLFNALKSANTAKALNNDINALFGKEMLSRMTFEDLTMMREVAFNMRDKMLSNESATFSYSGIENPSSFERNTGSQGRWAVNGYTDGKETFGFGMSISDVRTTGRDHHNTRFDRSFVVSAPYGYKMKSLQYVVSPEIGYSNGTYDRYGLNGGTFDGKVEKRMAALMNEVRYPIEMAGFNLIPTAELNVVSYNIRGSEKNKDFSLKIKSQNHYSVEAGLGLRATKEIVLANKSKLALSGSLAYYREFANPYELEVGMQGMDGTYKLKDERYGKNRVAARIGIDYSLSDKVDVSAFMLSNITREAQTDAKLNVKFKF